MAEQSTRKGKRRQYGEHSSKKNCKDHLQEVIGWSCLTPLFAQNYFTEFLKDRYPEIKYAEYITRDIGRDFFYYISKEKKLWDDQIQTSARYKTDKMGLSPTNVNIRLCTLKC